MISLCSCDCGVGSGAWVTMAVVGVIGSTLKNPPRPYVYIPNDMALPTSALWCLPLACCCCCRRIIHRMAVIDVIGNTPANRLRPHP